MRAVRVTSSLLFAAAAICGLVAAHKFVFGDFPNVPVVRDLPWHAVNPRAALALGAVLTVVAAHLGRRAVGGRVRA